MNQQRVVNVLLYYIGSFIFRPPRDQILYISYIFYHVDALSPICVLSRLHNPGLSGRLVLSTDFLELLVLVRFITRVVLLNGSFRSLALLAVLQILFNGFFLLFVFLFDYLFEVVIVGLEFLEVGIVNSQTRVERKRKDLEWVLTEHFVIASHIDKKTFFIGQLLILLHAVVKTQW